MTKNFSLWLLLGLLLTSLLSCHPSASQSIDFWTMQLQPQFTPYFNELISTFEAENQGLKVNWVDVPWSAMENKILTAVSALTAPDVVNLNPNFASELATREAWLDINSKISPSVKQQYLPNIWLASTIDNHTFAIPWYLTSKVTIYNSNLLKLAGISSPPGSYAELASCAEQVRKKTGKYAFFISFVPTDSAEVLESLVQMGVTLVDEKGRAAFNSPNGIAAFQYWVDLYQKGLLPLEVLTQGHRYGIELYQAGETALLFSGAEFLKSITVNAPSIAQVSAAAPQITGDTGLKNVAVMNLVIPRDSDKPDDALKFALFVTNTPNQLAFASAANVLPSTVDALDQYIEQLDRQAQITPVIQARKISAMQLKEAKVLVPPFKNLPQLQRIIYDNLQAAMLGEKTVEQALKDAEVEWNHLHEYTK